MLKMVNYTNPNGVYRPYLELNFYNNKSKKTQSLFSLVDSGVDSTLIPYELGLFLGLKKASDSELINASGVAGSLYIVNRKCEIGLINADNSKLFMFETEVSWAHPIKSELLELNNNLDIYNKYKKLKDNSDQTKAILKESYKKVNSILSKYGTNILLGRNFFINFDFLQFIEKKRGNVSKIIYKIREAEILREINI